MKEAKAVQKAPEQAYSLYGAKLYNFAYYSTYSAEDAQDLTQEAFLRYAQALGKGTQIENTQAYLYRIVRNLSINLARKKAREIGEGEHPIDIIEDANLYADPERAALLSGQRQEVLSATLSLSEEQRTALILKEIEGLGYGEIAEVMGSNENAVGALLSRGRLRFREAFRLGHIDTDQAEEECRAYLPLISRSLDGKLTANEEKLLDLHLEGCPFCRLAREEMQASTESYRSLVPLIPAAGLGAAILKAVSGGSASASAAATAAEGTASRLLLPVKAAGTKLAGLSLATKITVGIITGLLVVGGTVGGIVAGRGGDSVEDNSQATAAAEAEEEEVVVAYLKDGDIYYCLIDANGNMENGVLVDEVNSIIQFDVGENGDSIVYIVESPEREDKYLTETNTFYVFHIDSGEVREYEFDPGFSYVSTIGLDDIGDIWFSSGPGTAAGEYISKISVQDNEVTRAEFDLPEKGRFGGFGSGAGLISLKSDDDQLLISRHEYYPESGSYEELYLVTESGEVLKDYGYSLFSQDTTEIVPERWTSDGESLIGRMKDESGIGATNELFLIDEDKEVLGSYSVPEEHGELFSYDWDKSHNRLVYSTIEDKLFLVDTDSHEVLEKIDGGNLRDCRFIRPTGFKTYVQEKPELSDEEEASVRETIRIWVEGGSSMSEISFRWNSLTQDSPVRGYLENDEHYFEGIPQRFTMIWGDVGGSVWSRLKSCSISSINYDGKEVTIAITGIDVVFDENQGTEWEESFSDEYILHKENGEWKVHSVSWLKV